MHTLMLHVVMGIVVGDEGSVAAPGGRLHDFSSLNGLCTALCF